MKARKLLQTIGRPNTREYIKIIEGNQIPNCTITKRDIVNAENIFGPDLGTLKGKTTRQDPPQVRENFIGLPSEVHERYRDITLCADVMSVNGIRFLISISRNIHFGAVIAIKDKSIDTLFNGMQQILQIYQHGGFKVRLALMD